MWQRNTVQYYYMFSNYYAICVGVVATHLLALEGSTRWPCAPYAAEMALREMDSTSFLKKATIDGCPAPVCKARARKADFLTDSDGPSSGQVWFIQPNYGLNGMLKGYTRDYNDDSASCWQNGSTARRHETAAIVTRAPTRSSNYKHHRRFLQLVRLVSPSLHVIPIS
jgi:hypothetical protein